MAVLPHSSKKPSSSESMAMTDATNAPHHRGTNNPYSPSQRLVAQPSQETTTAKTTPRAKLDPATASSHRQHPPTGHRKRPSRRARCLFYPLIALILYPLILYPLRVYYYLLQGDDSFDFELISMFPSDNTTVYAIENILHLFPSENTTTTTAAKTIHDMNETIRHVVFSTYKCGWAKCSPRRQVAEDNSQAQWRAIVQRSIGHDRTNTAQPTVAFEDFSDIKARNISVNEFGVPILSSMYLLAQRLYPTALTFTYVNADILPEINFFDTVDAVIASPILQQRPFFIVGKRCNVDWYEYYNASDFHAHFTRRGILFNDDAQDFFVASRDSVPWHSIPPFVIGRPAYDNWLVDYAHHHQNISLVDGTMTMRVIHQTDEEGDKGWGRTLAKSDENLFYNTRLGRKQWDHGLISHAAYESFYLGSFGNKNESLQPQIRRRHTGPKQNLIVRVGSLQWDLFENWLFHWENLGIPVEKLIISAMDAATHARYAARSYMLPHTTHLASRANTNLPRILLHELQFVKHLVYTDLDTIWLANPFDHLKEGTHELICAVDRHDMSSHDGKPPAKLVGNRNDCRPGLLGVHRSPRVQTLLRRWAARLDQAATNAQHRGATNETFPALVEATTFRKALQEEGNRIVPVLTLPSVEFPDGIEYFVERHSENQTGTLVVHCNHLQSVDAKMEALHAVGLWNASSEITKLRQKNELILNRDAKFKIIILTMDRFASLSRLLQSLQATDYLSDQVDLEVRFDVPETPTSTWIQNVDAIQDSLQEEWKQGISTVTIADEHMGLDKAWLEAWKPTSDADRAIILGDDVTVSPLWYRWMRGAHDAYQNRSDIAGVSLQRQTVVAHESAQGESNIPDNGGLPFLYKLMGLIGFSPKASVWRDFLDFAGCIQASQIDVSFPGLTTSNGYNQKWAQLFLNFSDHHNLSTLYAFPRDNQALVTHWRKEGEPSGQTQGGDFALAQSPTVVSFEYPAELVSLGWDAKPVYPVSSVRSLVMSAAVGYKEEDFTRYVVGLRRHYQGSIALLISSSESPAVKKLLADNNVTVVETAEKGGPRDSIAWNRINKIRYNFYQDVCQESMYDFCMPLDFRDILFQGNPFEHMEVPSRPTLHVYFHNLRVNNWALNIARNCKGGNSSAMRGQWMINAGGIIASPSVIRQLNSFNEGFGSACDDQVSLNLAVYGNLLTDTTNVVMHKQGEGSINNVAYDGVFRTDSRQRFLSHNCFPSPVVHQFDAVEKTRGQSKLP